MGRFRRRWFVPVPEVEDHSELNDYLLDCCLADLGRTITGRRDGGGDRGPGAGSPAPPPARAVRRGRGRQAPGGPEVPGGLPNQPVLGAGAPGGADRRRPDLPARGGGLPPGDRGGPPSPAAPPPRRAPGTRPLPGAPARAPRGLPRLPSVASGAGTGDVPPRLRRVLAGAPGEVGRAGGDPGHGRDPAPAPQAPPGGRQPGRGRGPLPRVLRPPGGGAPGAPPRGHLCPRPCRLHSRSGTSAATTARLPEVDGYDVLLQGLGGRRP